MSTTSIPTWEGSIITPSSSLAWIGQKRRRRCWRKTGSKHWGAKSTTSEIVAAPRPTSDHPGHSLRSELCGEGYLPLPATRNRTEGAGVGFAAGWLKEYQEKLRPRER